MLVVGLTGSMGMGKSAIASMLRERGIAVCDADAVVHALYRGRAAPIIEAAFPGTTVGGAVDRARLAAALVADPRGFVRLESIVHPMVREEERAFLEREAQRGADIAVLEIPLLFESGQDRMVDVVIVASASADRQRERILARPGMTEERLASLLARQTPDDVKRSRADFVVDTNGSLDETRRQVDGIIATLGERRGTAFEQLWQACH